MNEVRKFMKNQLFYGDNLEVFRKFNVRTVFGTVSKINTGLRPVKGSFPFETDEIDNLESQGCSTTYVGQTLKNILKRMVEHKKVYKFCQSAVSGS